jgi:hypothetical protein
MVLLSRQKRPELKSEEFSAIFFYDDSKFDIKELVETLYKKSVLPIGEALARTSAERPV